MSKNANKSLFDRLSVFFSFWHIEKMKSKIVITVILSRTCFWERERKENKVCQVQPSLGAFMNLKHSTHTCNLDPPTIMHHHFRHFESFFKCLSDLVCIADRWIQEDGTMWRIIFESLYKSKGNIRDYKSHTRQTKFKTYQGANSLTLKKIQ